MYALNTKVRYSEIGPDGRMTIPAVVNILQDCCAAQSEELGVGLLWLNERGMGWYITNWEVKIHSLPFMHEDIIVKTWPYRFRGMFGYRNFSIENAGGERLVEVDSFWVLMNIREGKPTRVPKEMLDKYEISPKLEGEWSGRKLKLVDQPEEEGRIEVSPAQIDTNRHMNNSRYVELSYGMLPQDEKFGLMRTEYKKPAMLGDEIIIRRGHVEDMYQVGLFDTAGGLFAVSEFVRSEK